ncbi:hypothetical protein CK627_18920 [Aeromonas dhakensis]|uniref:dynamin family protein n=1 Tax=Aeromonas dhakensis TaxID=196024 RepID=UPI000BAB10CA|nr:dynamin family protein [Aeromonas dhakensis]ASX12707.1 hypothetical protein CK627_18920 [Aeromonas dhakensis]
MLNEQVFLKESLPRLQVLWSAHEFPTEELAALEVELNQFSVRLPLIGSFSAGKSSLINFLLGDSLLSVAVNPETCLPTELRHAESEAITLHHSNRSDVCLDREALKAQAFGEITASSWVEVATPSPVLAKLGGMTLVDMPGWESGIEQHSNAIDNYLERSSAYCVVVSVDEGGLKDSLKKIIEELAIYKKPMMLILTKCDKKTPEDVASVLAQVQGEIESITGIPLLSVSKAQRKQPQEWANALQEIIPLNQQFFHQRVGSQFERHLETLMTHLNKLLNSENFTIEQIKGKQAQLHQDKERLQQDLQQTQQQLQSQVITLAAFVCDQFASRLNSQLDTLAGHLLHHGDINGVVGTALRMAYATGVEERLKPLISSKLSQLERLTEGEFGELSFDHNFQLNSVNGGLLKDVIGNLLPLVMAALTRIPALMIFAPILKTILGSLFDNAAKEVARREQREEARQYVLRNLIPDCLAQVKDPIEQALAKGIEQVISTVKGEAERELRNFQQSLAQLAEQLASEQANDNANKARLQQEHAELAALLTKVKAFGHE